MRDKQKRSASVRWPLLLLLAAGALLLVAALGMEKPQEPAGWSRLNDELAATLGGEEKADNSGSGLSGGLEEEGAAENSGTVPNGTKADKALPQVVAASENDAGPEQPGLLKGEQLVDELGRLNINLAGVEQLDALPGIGPAKAQAIVDDRARNGRFQTVDDLVRVKGIGPKMLEKIKNSIVVLP